MKIAVVGGEGFIGRHIVEYIDDYTDDDAWSYDLPRLDIRDKRAVWDLLSGHDAVINVAGLLGTHELFDNIQDAIDVNISGQFNVAQFCQIAHKPLVTVEQPHVWINPYETTRGAGVRLARALAHSKGLRLSVVKAYNAFGEGQAYGPGHPQKFVPTFSVQAWNGGPIEVYSHGNQWVNMIYVKDLAQIFYEAIEWASEDVSEFMGAATGGNWKVNQVADMVARQVGDMAFKHLPMRAGETHDEGVIANKWDIIEANEGKVLVPTFKGFDLFGTVQWYKGIPLDGSTDAE